MLRRDEEIQQQIKAVMADLKCVNGFQITRICDNAHCNNHALFCVEPTCSPCHDLHQSCRSYSFEKFAKMVQKRSAGPLSEFEEHMEMIEQGLIERIREKKKKTAPGRFDFQELRESLDSSYFHMIEDIFKRKNVRAITGQEATELFERLQDTQIQAQSREQQLLESYQSQAWRILEEYAKVRDWIRDSAMNRRHAERQQRQQDDPFKVDSAILKKKNLGKTVGELTKSPHKKVAFFAEMIMEELSRQDKIFLKECLPMPSMTLDLVYRASENEFRASTFHERCNDISNTILLAYNQHGKTVGGFTPHNWAGQNVFKGDQFKTSFLFSMDLLCKMPFTGEKSIYCSPTEGPVFGGDKYFFQLLHHYDLKIGDKCNTQANSEMHYPHAYGAGQSKTGVKKLTCEDLVGVERGKGFKIVEYQVFRVGQSEKDVIMIDEVK